MAGARDAWSDERIEQLASMLRLGKGYTDIASELGGSVTRAAVAGKAFKLRAANDARLPPADRSVARVSRLGRVRSGDLEGCLARVWTNDLDDRLFMLLHQGRSNGEIGEALGGMSRNAVGGRVNRLRLAGDPRIPAVGHIPAGGISNIDALAGLMADGCSSFYQAARRLRLRPDHVRDLWWRICQGLGPQAV